MQPMYCGHVSMGVFMHVQECACVSTCFIADFSVCGTCVTCVSRACCAELVANFYRTCTNYVIARKLCKIYS